MAGLAGALLRGASRRGLEPAAALAPAARGLGARPLAGVADRRGARARLRLAARSRDEAAVNSWAHAHRRAVVAWSLYVVQTQLLGLLWFDWLWGRFAREATVPRAASTRSGSASPWPAWWPCIRAAVDLTFLSTAVLGQRAARRGHAARRQRLRHAGRAGRAGRGVVAAARGCRWRWPCSRSTPSGCGCRARAPRSSARWPACWASRPRSLLGASPVRRRAPRRTCAIAAVAVASLVVGALVAGGRRHRAAAPDRRGAAVARGLADLWSRGGYGTIAVQMLRDTPWTGVGPGMYHVIAPDYWRVIAADDAGVRQRAELVAASGGGARRARRGCPCSRGRRCSPPALARGRRRARPRRRLAAARASLAGIGAGVARRHADAESRSCCSGSSALVAWWGAASTGALAEGRVHAPGAAPALAVALGVVVLLHAAGTAVLARGWLSVPERAKRAHRDYIVGAYDARAARRRHVVPVDHRRGPLPWTRPRRAGCCCACGCSIPTPPSSPVRVTADHALQACSWTRRWRPPRRSASGIELPEGTGVAGGDRAVVAHLAAVAPAARRHAPARRGRRVRFGSRPPRPPGTQTRFVRPRSPAIPERFGSALPHRRLPCRPRLQCYNWCFRPPAESRSCRPGRN